LITNREINHFYVTLHALNILIAPLYSHLHTPESNISSPSAVAIRIDIPSGRQDLDTLEKWVHKYFTPVPNKNAPDPALEWWGKVKPFIPQKAANVLEVVPVGELRRLSISWPVSIPSPERRYVDRLLVIYPPLWSIGVLHGLYYSVCLNSLTL
jgi:hypothetical protein